MTELYEDGITAAKATARSMTSGVRQSALSQGWNKTTAAKVSVSFDQSTHTLSLKGLDDPKVADMEYGTENSAPAPAVRQFVNQRATYEKQFIYRLSKEVGISL